MKIAYFSNYFNHHQKPIGDIFNEMSNIEYTFVATETIPEFRVKLGYKKISADYVIDTTVSIDNKRKAMRLAKEADVAIFMAGGLEEYIIPRLKLNKLTFEVSERRFKRGYINMLSPNLIKHQIMYFLFGRKAPLYLLCSSAYAANDYNFLGSYVDRCFKWAYFTHVDCNYSLSTNRNDGFVKIMWCGRFIDWKHPELPILLASRLKTMGYQFSIDMYGNGKLLKDMMELAKDNSVDDVVHFCGNHHNEAILEAMRAHQIYLFTSDRNEGWGAVANESMSNGCALVGSEQIGSVPFLVEDNINGLIYKGTDIDSLTEKVKYLLDNPLHLDRIRRNAVKTMQDVWSPQVAAERFVRLAENLHLGKNTPYSVGPCSKATPIHNN